MRPRVVAAAAVILGLTAVVPGAQAPGGGAASIQPGAPSAPAWRNAEPGYVFRFPAVHASHPEYGIEWWYYTGNLTSPDGRRFGYQVTFFRVGIDVAPASRSRWAVRDIFMAHVAVSDPAGRRHRYGERLSRTGPGLAGALVDRYRVWIEDWSAERDVLGRHVLAAAGPDVGVELVLDEGEPPIVNGKDGISRKGSRPGNASHYYSLMRMPTQGVLTIDGERVDVTGSSWMDHEFGTSFLEPDQQGWDWLSAQLDDGSELMMYRLRTGSGGVDPHSSGTHVGPDGRVTHLSAKDFEFVPQGPTFRSPATGARYPVAWRARVPSIGIDLAVETPLADQELRTVASTGVTYWEGAIDVSGTSRGRRVAGRGYLEMTGYAGSMAGFSPGITERTAA